MTDEKSDQEVLDALLALRESTLRDIAGSQRILARIYPMIRDLAAPRLEAP